MDAVCGMFDRHGLLRQLARLHDRATGSAGLVLLSRAATLRRCHASDQERRSTNERRHASAVFWVSFLVYSTTSATIFQTVACDDLDDETSFLRRVDHQGFMWYVGVMSIVYPFGIPFCYALSLHGGRNEMKSGQ